MRKIKGWYSIIEWFIITIMFIVSFFYWTGPGFLHYIVSFAWGFWTLWTYLDLKKLNKKSN